MDRRKELKLQYKQMKPEMGVIIIRSELDNKCYLEGTQNIKGTINSAKFKLEAGIHQTVNYKGPGRSRVKKFPHSSS